MGASFAASGSRATAGGVFLRAKYQDIDCDDRLNESRYRCLHATQRNPPDYCQELNATSNS